MQTDLQKDALRRAIEKAGGPARLGALMGLSRSAPCFWMRTRLPIERVAEVSRLTGVPKYELRPDVFDVPSRRQAQDAA